MDARVPQAMGLLAHEEHAVDAPVLGHVECVLAVCIGGPGHTDAFGAPDCLRPVEAAQTLPGPQIMWAWFGRHASKTEWPPLFG